MKHTHLNRHKHVDRNVPLKQRGLTLIELMVAMVISLLIAMAAIAALTISRQGFTTVDAASQLRDNGRFVSDLIQRLGVQSGFKDEYYAARPPTAQELAADLIPNITGANNSYSTLVPSSTNPNTAYKVRGTGDLGNGSDVLYFRNQLVQANPGSPDADGSMIDCMGNALTAGAAPATRNERMINMLHVAESPQNSGELALMCTTVDSKGTITDQQPIVQGVENFQVLYGVQGVTTPPTKTYGLTADAPAPTTSAAWQAWAATVNQVPDQYLRADQMTAATTIDTNANWRRVRSLRIGLVLRGPPHSAQSSAAQTLYPFGQATSSNNGSPGSAFASANDPGTIFNAPADGRLRQVVTFTVHLRNSQGL